VTLDEAIQAVKALPVDVAVVAAIERAKVALVELSTMDHYSPRDRTGEDSTRRVQVKAARGLRQLDGSG
jgi:hypothetical protein